MCKVCTGRFEKKNNEICLFINVHQQFEKTTTVALHNMYLTTYVIAEQ